VPEINNITAQNSFTKDLRFVNMPIENTQFKRSGFCVTEWGVIDEINNINQHLD
jgi:arginine deiminase